MISTLFEPGEIIRWRKELDLTQQKLAELSGLSLRTVIRLEHAENKRGGTIYTLSQIAKALETARRERYANRQEGVYSSEPEAEPIMEDTDER